MVLIRIVGRIGFAAKGAILGVVDILLLLAAWRVEEIAAGGMRAALEFLGNVPLGNAVLLAISAGLLLHGVFGLMVAWWHRPVSP